VPTYDRQHLMCIRLRLIAAREDAGMSQGEAARRVGIHRPTLSLLESGGQQLRVSEMLALCDLYEVDPRDLVRLGYDTSPVPQGHGRPLARRPHPPQ
jgi:DNA-binding XRE family transcriptional regulator